MTRPLLTRLILVALCAWALGAGTSCTLSPEEKAEIFTEEWRPFEYQYPQHSFMYDGMRIVYIDVHSDSSSTPVILIHGLAATLNNWDFVVDALARERRVIALDLPGYGNSDKPHRDYTMDLFSGTVVALMDHLGIPQAHIAGNSMGGHVTSYTAYAYPDRVASINIVNGAGAVGVEGTEGLRTYQQRVYETALWFASRNIPRTHEEAEAWYEQSIHDLETRQKMPMGVNPFYRINENALEFFKRQKAYAYNFRSKEFPAFLYAVVSSIFGVAEAPIGPIAGDIKAPALILAGRNDDIAPIQGSIDFHNALPHSKLVILDECGHMPQVEQAGQFLTIYTEFLADPESAVTG